ncbi:hypothetical protein MES4922_30427 [Mesorhizobium ventifaucium]|uniref:Response regulatory domain-containing protein n=1 Tax=Mesorhizobium ventifaucium TaxID=666020 RepID=A0ABN8JWI4_9HYPH|nr:hypothetical protein MES4922_30427 [Mesorhizobium ventifaucium]
MRRSVERLLNAHGFPTEGYGSAETFLGRDPASSILCVVLDIQLGGISGLELMRHLQSSDPWLPVIFITAVDDGARSKPFAWAASPISKNPSLPPC